MRAVVDTNVLLSGLIWRGAPHALIEQVRAGTLGLVSSPALLAEWTGVIARPTFHAALARANASAEQMLAELRLLVEISNRSLSRFRSVAIQTAMPCSLSPWHLRPISSYPVMPTSSPFASMPGFRS